MNRAGFFLVFVFLSAACEGNPDAAKQFIEKGDKECGNYGHEIISKKWDAAVANDADRAQKEKAVTDANDRYTKYFKGTYDQYKPFQSEWEKFSDPNLKRMFLLWDYGTDVLDAGDADKLAKIEKDIKDKLDKIEVKSMDNKGKLKFADMKQKVVSDFSNADEMKHYWTEWHNAGKSVKDLFTQWIELQNKAAVKNGLPDVVHYWQRMYEVGDYEQTMVPLVKAIEPLFQNLHAYIRYKLWDFHKKNENIIKKDGPIPASLLGWKWGLDASPLVDRFRPFPNKPKLDITQGLKSKNIKGKTMAETIDKFFRSLGFQELPKNVYDDSVFEKKDHMDCSGENNYDYNDGKTYKMKMCAEPTVESYDEAIRIVSFTEYSIAYKNIPQFFFKRPPGKPFGAAILDLMIRFNTSPNYLKSIGLVGHDFPVDHDQQINFLFEEALTWVFFLPYGLAYDMFRWHVAEKKIKPDEYNCAYWKLVTQYQGVEPPIDRNNNDFDAGVRPAAMGGTQYMWTFITKFMEYDMVRGLCGPNPKDGLVFCDINNNKDAGRKLKEAMSLGNSKPWTEALQKITGRNTLDASALMEYFKPLNDWLTEQNNKNGAKPGWRQDKPKCP